MSTDYWLGVATLPALFLIWAFIIEPPIYWLLWWASDPRTRLGRGLHHTFESRIEGEWWPASEHVHYWPSGTPWWLIQNLEPLRVRLCLRDPDRRKVGG